MLQLLMYAGRCLAIPFNIAELNTRVISSDRKAVLLHSVALYKEFITLCDAYDLISSVERTAAENAGTGKPVSVLPTDPGARRTAKIAQFKAEKELKAKIEVWGNPLWTVSLLLQTKLGSRVYD